MAQVLVVDDSATVRDEVSASLTGAGIAVATANDGADALEKIKGDNDLKLIICDVNMPNIDGLTMVEKVRNEIGNTSVQVIMLTTESDESMKQRGKAAGIKGWIVKPYNPDNAIPAIKKLLGI